MAACKGRITRAYNHPHPSPFHSKKKQNKNFEYLFSKSNHIRISTELQGKWSNHLAFSDTTFKFLAVNRVRFNCTRIVYTYYSRIMIIFYYISSLSHSDWKFLGTPRLLVTTIKYTDDAKCNKRQRIPIPSCLFIQFNDTSKPYKYNKKKYWKTVVNATQCYYEL